MIFRTNLLIKCDNWEPITLLATFVHSSLLSQKNSHSYTRPQACAIFILHFIFVFTIQAFFKIYYSFRLFGHVIYEFSPLRDMVFIRLLLAFAYALLYYLLFKKNKNKPKKIPFLHTYLFHNCRQQCQSSPLMNSDFCSSQTLF